MHPVSRIRRFLLPPGSRRDKLAWLARLTVWKMREGPGPWLRAVRRGLYDALPARTKARIVRRRLGAHARAPARVACAHGFDLERPRVVSVVLPVKDHASMLAGSIRSVLAQSHVELELIVVDDGSTDDVDAVLREFASDARVRILRQNNQKLPKALSNGFSFATGQYRTWTSADNESLPEQLATLLRCLESDTDVGMVYSDYLVIDEAGAPLRGSTFRPHDRSSPESAEIHLPRDSSALSVVQDNFVGASFLYRAAAGRALGDYVPKLGVEDYDYWMRMRAEFDIRHLGTDDVLYRYRWHDNSLNARAREIRLYESGRALVQHEAERARFRALPWSGDTKRIALLEAAEAEALPAPSDACSYVAVTWGPDVELPFAREELLRGARVGHFTTHPAVANRLALWTDQVWVVDEPAAIRRLAEACAHERLHFLDHNAPNERMRALPWPWRESTEPLKVRMLPGDGAPATELTTRIDECTALAECGIDASLCLTPEQRAAIEVGGPPPNEPLPAHTPEDLEALLAAGDAFVLLARRDPGGSAMANLGGATVIRVLSDQDLAPSSQELEAMRLADAHTHAYICESTATLHFACNGLGIDTAKLLLSAEFSREEQALRLSCVLGWIAAGGAPAGARPWLRPEHEVDAP